MLSNNPSAYNEIILKIMSTLQDTLPMDDNKSNTIQKLLGKKQKDKEETKTMHFDYNN
jgi:hypothetical protein